MILLCPLKVYPVTLKNHYSLNSLFHLALLKISDEVHWKKRISQIHKYIVSFTSKTYVFEDKLT